MPASRALHWFGEAMRLWKRAPATFAAIAFVVILASLLLEPVPVAGFVAANVVAPLLACGLLFASLAADRGERARVRLLVAAFAVPLPAQVAIVLSGFVALAFEAFAAWQVAEVNLLLPLKDATSMPNSAILLVYAAGVLASLPVTFVPMAALFDGEGIRNAFALSLSAFARNVPALLLLAAYSYALLMLGLATMGVGLVLALPWIAAASYAAWKDVFAVA
ncbi:MAG: hypothetical protein U1F15_00860 [Burkholderiales bacterium]